MLLSRAFLVPLTVGLLAALPAVAEPLHRVCDVSVLAPSDMKQCHWQMKTAASDQDRQRIHAIYEAKAATRRASGVPESRPRYASQSISTDNHGLGITGGQPLNLFKPY